MLVLRDVLRGRQGIGDRQPEPRRVLVEARRRAEFDYEEFDIDRDPGLLRLYNDEVPVIAINSVKAFKYKLDIHEFLKKLAARA